jgi:hypothetical protein
VNVLILGGLLLVAAAAIIGAVLLGVSEQRAEVRRHSSGQAPLPQESQPPLVTRPLEDEAAASSPPLSPGGETTTTLARGVEATEEEHGPPSLNGQVHELAGEMRALHRQAWQLEQRLNALVEVVEQMENGSSEHHSFEEGPHPTSEKRLIL